MLIKRGPAYLCVPGVALAITPGGKRENDNLVGHLGEKPPGHHIIGLGKARMAGVIRCAAGGCQQKGRGKQQLPMPGTFLRKSSNDWNFLLENFQ